MFELSSLGPLQEVVKSETSPGPSIDVNQWLSTGDDEAKPVHKGSARAKNPGNAVASRRYQSITVASGQSIIFASYVRSD